MTTREPISIENGRVEIHTPENRVWLTRHQIADLFGVFVPAVGSNIRSILKSGILREERVYRRERNRDGGIVELYSLEMIAALAFRLKSGNAEAFRRWLVRRDKKKWNECLSKIAVKTNDEDQRAIFYTAMYHAFLSPNPVSYTHLKPSRQPIIPNW